MQVQNQTQQVAEEELLLPLSDDELASIAGGAPPPMLPFPSKNPLDQARRRSVIARWRNAARSSWWFW